MSHRLSGKVKVEYEPIPIIGVGNPEVIDEGGEVVTAPTEGGVRQPKPSVVVSIENPVEIDDVTALRPLAEQYKAPPVVSVATVPTIISEDHGGVPSVATAGKVVNIIKTPDEPIDETLDGSPKIFGRRLKDPVTVK